MKPRPINLNALKTIARRLDRLRRTGGGSSALVDPQAAAVNLSYVLHAPSTSTTVTRAVEASQRDATPGREPEIVLDGDRNLQVDVWLVPSVGYPDNVAASLESRSPVLIIDAGEPPRRPVTFFRATATLTVPEGLPASVGVAALIRRPGGSSRQLILRGPFAWPEQERDAIRMLESIIQAHVEQWRPREQLWAMPAEDTLPEMKR